MGEISCDFCMSMYGSVEVIIEGKAFYIVDKRQHISIIFAVRSLVYSDKLLKPGTFV